MKHKALASILAASLILSLTVGCGGSKPMTSPASPAPAPSMSASTATPAPVEEENITFKFVSTNQSALLNEACEKIAKEIEEKSGGSLKATLYLEGQLCTSEEDLLTGVSEGSFEVTAGAEMPFNFASPEWMGLFNMVFCFRDTDHLQNFWKSEVGAQLNDALRTKYNIFAHLETVALRGPRYVTANKAITKVDDMKGLKFRTPNNPGVIQCWTASGANVTPVTWGELFGALQGGIVEAQENPLANIDQAALYQVQSHLMQTEHQYTNFFIFFNQDWYSTLSDNQKKILSDAINNAFIWQNEQVKANDEAFIKTFEEKGMTVIKKEDIDLDSFKEQIIPVALEANKGVYVDGGWEKIQGM